MSDSFAINNYRFEEIKSKYLVTTDHGSFVFLNKNDFNLLRDEKIKENSKLFKLLEEKGVVITESNENKIIEEFRNKNSFLFQGTSLHIVIPTLRCNMKCVYCHASSRPINSRGFDMDKNTAKKTVDFIFQSPSKAITIEFQGGEPLLNFEIIKFVVDYANKLNKKHKKNLLFTVVTNLSLMDNKKLKFLMDNNVGICTSLDGPEKLHDRNRKLLGKSNYSYIVKWVSTINKEYRKRKISRKLGALITITKESLKYPKEIVDEYVKLGFDDIHLRFLNNLGDARPVWDSISYSSGDFIGFWKKAVDYIIGLNKKGKKIKERMATIMLKKAFNKRDTGYLDLRSPCGAAIGQLAYNYNGDIYTCDEARMIGEDLFKIGNVKNDKYKDVLTSNQVCSIISASTNEVYICDSCAFKPYCGVCPVCNYAEQGSIIGKISETDRCGIFKAQFDYIFGELQDKKTKDILIKWTKHHV